VECISVKDTLVHSFTDDNQQGSMAVLMAKDSGER